MTMAVPLEPPGPPDPPGYITDLCGTAGKVGKGSGRGNGKKGKNGMKQKGTSNDSKKSQPSGNTQRHEGKTMKTKTNTNPNSSVALLGLRRRERERKESEMAAMISREEELIHQWHQRRAEGDKMMKTNGTEQTSGTNGTEGTDDSEEWDDWMGRAMEQARKKAAGETIDGEETEYEETNVIFRAGDNDDDSIDDALMGVCPDNLAYLQELLSGEVRVVSDDEDEGDGATGVIPMAAMDMKTATLFLGRQRRERERREKKKVAKKSMVSRKEEMINRWHQRRIAEREMTGAEEAKTNNSDAKNHSNEKNSNDDDDGSNEMDNNKMDNNGDKTNMEKRLEKEGRLMEEERVEGRLMGEERVKEEERLGDGVMDPTTRSDDEKTFKKGRRGRSGRRRSKKVDGGENATFDDDDPWNADGIKLVKKLKKDRFVYPGGTPLLLMLPVAPLILKTVMLLGEGSIDT